MLLTTGSGPGLLQATMAESLCCFCQQGYLGVEKVGETFRKDGVTVHENCLVKICESVGSDHVAKRSLLTLNTCIGN